VTKLNKIISKHNIPLEKKEPSTPNLLPEDQSEAKDFEEDRVVTNNVLREAQHYPMLSQDEEQHLIKKWFLDKSPKTAQHLVKSHLRLIIKIATQFKGYKLPLHDLISEGTVGFMEALKRFDPEKGFRLSTYAVWWVRASIKDYILKASSLVKFGSSRNQKKLFFGLRKLKAEIKQSNPDIDYEDLTERISGELDISKDEVVAMDLRLSRPDYSLNAPIHQKGEGDWQDWLEDTGSGHEDTFIQQDQMQVRKKLLAFGMECLSPREKDIIASRQLTDNPPTLQDIAEKYKLSRERIRQIESQAFTKLQNSISRKAAELRLADYPDLSPR